MPRRSEGKLPPKNDHCQALGRLFRDYRERRKLTLRQLANGVGLCEFTLRRHEAGNMMLRTDDLEHAAGIMGIDAAHLLIRGGRNDRTSTAE
jgi:transcriptional regulator with XRE-family HTH domain